MAKIAASAVFVADVTPIGEMAKRKPLPNPNVMVELGWSLNKPGDGRQIYVLNNTADGWKVEQLPFDIRHRRVLAYTLAQNYFNQSARQEHHYVMTPFSSPLSAIDVEAAKLNVNLENAGIYPRVGGLHAQGARRICTP